MFNGNIEINSDYYAIKSIDSIFTVMENFRKTFDLEILDIVKEIEDDIVEKYIFELEQTTITFVSARFKYVCEIITYDELEKFCEMYNYLKYYLTNFDFTVGDVYYRNHKQGVVTDVVDDNYVLVKDGYDKEPVKNYKCWGMRLN